MEGIVRPFVLHKQVNEQATDYTHRQTKDIDQELERLFFQISERNFEVVFEHDVMC